jgi:hypothetical protein
MQEEELEQCANHWSFEFVQCDLSLSAFLGYLFWSGKRLLKHSWKDDGVDDG